MKIKNRLLVLLLPIFIISITTSNFLHTSIEDNGHSHGHQNSIAHVHQHTHSKVTHSHSHSSSLITVFDYFCSLSVNDKSSELNKSDNNFELKHLHSQEVINKRHKPPKFS